MSQALEGLSPGSVRYEPAVSKLFVCSETQTYRELGASSVIVTAEF
jgi:hypothetical protein